MLIPVDVGKLVAVLSTTAIPMDAWVLSTLHLCRRLVQGGITRVYLTAEEYLEIEQYL